MYYIIAIVVILALIYLLYVRQSFTAPDYEIAKRTKHPVYFLFYGDKPSAPRGYTEKDYILADALVTDSWKDNVVYMEEHDTKSQYM